MVKSDEKTFVLPRFLRFLEIERRSKLVDVSHQGLLESQERPSWQQKTSMPTTQRLGSDRFFRSCFCC